MNNKERLPATEIMSTQGSLRTQGHCRAGHCGTASQMG